MFWSALSAALEERLFQQARQLKRDACARALRGVVEGSQNVLAKSRQRAVEAADDLALVARVDRDAGLGGRR